MTYKQILLHSDKNGKNRREEGRLGLRGEWYAVGLKYQTFGPVCRIWSDYKPLVSIVPFDSVEASKESGGT